MKDWYRNKTWTKTDEEEFFVRLGRAKKDGRAQYLKIQAIELIQTNDKTLLKAAETLLNKMLTEYPDDNFNKSSALHSLGDIYKINENYEKAINYYKQAIDFEKVYPNVKTNSFLDFSELVVKTNKTELFDFVESLLVDKLSEQIFPDAIYKMYSILSIISAFKSEHDKAKLYADLAEQSASAETSGLRYHKYLGIVKERDNWLDKLVNENKNSA